MVILAGQALTLAEIVAVASEGAHVEISPSAVARMASSRSLIDRIVSNDQPVYGVNTGFGRLSDIRIPSGELAQLQVNLVRSHACGVGEPLSEPEVRAMLLLRANVLACGYSGARPLVAQTLAHMLNAGVTPVVPSRGSVGACGDLAPLAHLALVAIGEGEATYQGRRLHGAEAMRAAGVAPLALQAKEGLALLNGTQAMGAVGGLALDRAWRLWHWANAAGAMTLEALRDTPAAFDERIQAIRPHAGQLAAAALLRALLDGSEIRESHRLDDPRVQDAYSIRCMPQVHGAVHDALAYVQRVVEIESGAATDNPLVFADSDEVVSGGNFHGAPLAHAFDFAAIAIADLASISERRIDRLVNPDLNEGLPAFLAHRPGMESGLMMAHVTAAGLLNEIKGLAHPASIDNVPTSGGKEDHVSMGMTAALKLRDLVGLAEHVVAIELLAAAEGLEHRRPLRSGHGVEGVHAKVRTKVEPLEGDRPLGADIECLANLIRTELLTPA